MSAKRRTKIEIVKDMLEVLSEQDEGGGEKDENRVWSEFKLRTGIEDTGVDGKSGLGEEGLG